MPDSYWWRTHLKKWLKTVGEAAVFAIAAGLAAAFVLVLWVIFVQITTITVLDTINNFHWK